MTSRERFRAVLDFKKPDDRLPMIEWAPWWDKTIKRWLGEGIPAGYDGQKLQDWFGLDVMICVGGGAGPRGAGNNLKVSDRGSYAEMRKYIFADQIIEDMKHAAEALAAGHERGEIVIRLWLDGFFWFPRKLFGIEEHMYAFYDHPELMKEINEGLAEFNIKTIDAIFEILTPDMAGFAEDMSYNHGPMLSEALFDEFIAPYYKKVIPHLKKRDIKAFVDSDGEVTEMLPWLKTAGIEGVYPLERQAGVDIVKIREKYPDFLMMGGFDKMTMNRGEQAMRAEFERLLPVMRSGGYIPSVDHQTPPGVSLSDYKLYLKLFREYCAEAVK